MHGNAASSYFAISSLQERAFCREASAGLAGAGNKSAGAAVRNFKNGAGCAGGSRACRWPSMLVVLPLTSLTIHCSCWAPQCIKEGYQ